MRAYITKTVENIRLNRKVSQKELAEAMGIDARAYRRKLDKTTGFNDRELCGAMAHLGLFVYITERPIEDILQVCNK